MPVVQDKYTIDVTNRFGISEDVVEDSGDEIENVDPFALINEMEAQAEEAKKQPKKKVQKKAAPAPKKEEAPVEEKKVDKKRGPGGAKREGQRRDGQRPRGDRPPREPRQGGDVDGARENRPRRDRGDGERRPRRENDERRPRREGDGNRRFDRKSGDPRSSYKGSDKREGAGQGNWGTEKDELKGQTEAVTEEKPSEENADVKEPVAAPAPVEEEEKTLTLEEYMKQKKNIVKNSNAKVVASAETEQKEEFKREKKGRAARYESLDFNAVAFRPARRERDGDRDNRRGPPRDNNRRGPPRENKREEKKEKSGFNLAGDEFPSL